MKLTVTELRQAIREVLAGPLPSWDDEDDDLDPIVIQDPNGSLRWQEDEDTGRKFIYTKQGTYDWSPSTGHLTFVSNTNGRTQKLSKDLNPRRSGGFHDMKTEEQAAARVKQHAVRQKQ